MCRVPPLTDEEKAELKRLQEELATLQNELRPVDGKLRELENLRSNVTDSEPAIMQQLNEAEHPFTQLRRLSIHCDGKALLLHI